MPTLDAAALKDRATNLKNRLDALSESGSVTAENLNEIDRDADRLAKDLQEFSDWLARKEEDAQRRL